VDTGAGVGSVAAAVETTPDVSQMASGPDASKAAGAQPGPEAAPAPFASAVDARSGESLLQSLAATPPSAFSATLDSARDAVGTIHAREQEQLRESLPEVQQPTGLPVRDAAPPAPAVPADLRVGAPPAPARGAPGPGIAAAAEAPSPDGDSAQPVVIDAGPAPTVDLSGDADPAQAAASERSARAQATAVQSDADEATSAGFGEHDIAPTVTPQTLRPTVESKVPPAADTDIGVPLPLPSASADVLAQLDATAAPQLAAQTQARADEYAKRQADYESTVQTTQRDSRRQIAEATATTRAEQETMAAVARADVDGQRRRWQQGNRRISERVGIQAGARRREVEREVDARVQSSHKQAASKLVDAKHEAAAAKKRAESEAAKKADEAKSDKPKSAWEKVKGAVKSGFDAVRSAVTSIFDRLRRVVRTIVDKAKRAARGLISAARRVVVTLFRRLGAFVKACARSALRGLRELAVRAGAWIVRRLRQAADFVTRAARKLKQLVTRALDMVATLAARALDILQRGLRAILAALNAAARALRALLDKLLRIPHPPPLPETQSSGVQIGATEKNGSGSEEDFRHHDFPSISLASHAKLALWASAHSRFGNRHLVSDPECIAELTGVLGGLAGSAGVAAVTRFVVGTGGTESLGPGSILGTLALRAPAFKATVAAVKHDIEGQLAKQAGSGHLDPLALWVTLPPTFFDFGDGVVLKSVIGGTQGASLIATSFAGNAAAREYKIGLRFEIRDDFGVGESDIYAPGLAAFWVLQHERGTGSIYVPFVNQLELPVVLGGTF